MGEAPVEWAGEDWAPSVKRAGEKAAALDGARQEAAVGDRPGERAGVAGNGLERNGGEVGGALEDGAGG